jgi:hypothetical protein
MTVAQLATALFWGALSVLPCMFFFLAGDDRSRIEGGTTLGFLLGMALQVFFGVACYMAGANS